MGCACMILCARLRGKFLGYIMASHCRLVRFLLSASLVTRCGSAATLLSEASTSQVFGSEGLDLEVAAPTISIYKSSTIHRVRCTPTPTVKPVRRGIFIAHVEGTVSTFLS
jgi:hypothetical protein